ncbi:uncharacterized protein LOC131078465 [Cryptomeria japonica]|uniref:uncharacterized protein LOC131078465 n=1 Tax=Cryptomeria japonica TaxID=3369 RepID=UPI0027DA1355|nr:uncharacterized protein LOC131078465 [Cryptomeria japonica]
METNYNNIPTIVKLSFSLHFHASPSFKSQILKKARQCHSTAALCISRISAILPHLFYKHIQEWVNGVCINCTLNKERFPCLVREGTPTPFSALNFFKRQPLQEISRLFATNYDTQSISDEIRMSSVVDMRGLVEQTSGVGNKKRKSRNLSDDSSISSSNLKRSQMRGSSRSQDLCLFIAISNSV